MFTERTESSPILKRRLFGPIGAAALVISACGASTTTPSGSSARAAEPASQPAGALVSVIPMMVCLLFAHRHFVRGIALTVVKG